MFRKMWNKYHVGVFVDACKYGDTPQVLMMLEKEPDLAYLKDKKGNSTLIHAVANGHERIADALLHITKQPNDVEPEKGFTPLLLAATDGHTAMVHLLLEHGANPNMKNFDGLTALHNAVFEKQIDIVKLLLEYGADPTIKDRFGNTPIDLAQGSAHPQLRQLFDDATANQKKVNNNGKANHSNMPSHSKLASKLASLIDDCSLKELKESNACITLGKDFSIAYVVDLKTFENQFRYDLAKVYLREVPNFESLLFCRKEYQNPQHPVIYFATDLFTREALKILLEQKCRIEDEETGRDGDFIAYNNGTVLDTRTNLMWAAKDNGSYIDWQNAKSYCENYLGGGYTDWRMPTQDELAGLYDENKSRPAACNREANLHVATEFIDITCFAPWALETSGSEAAYFNFYNGSRSWITQTDTYAGLRALPVRFAK